jgi:hypothetical protein
VGTQYDTRDGRYRTELDIGTFDIRLKKGGVRRYVGYQLNFLTIFTIRHPNLLLSTSTVFDMNMVTHEQETEAKPGPKHSYILKKIFWYGISDCPILGRSDIGTDVNISIESQSTSE